LDLNNPKFKILEKKFMRIELCVCWTCVEVISADMTCTIYCKYRLTHGYTILLLNLLRCFCCSFLSLIS